MSAAYLRILGGTQEECAKSVGITRRTLIRWEQDEPAWTAAREEARERWLGEAADASRNTLLNAVKGGDAASARWILERADEKLAPRAGAAGGVAVFIYLPDNGRDARR